MFLRKSLKKRYLFLLLAALGLCGWTWALIVESGGYALDAVPGLLIAVAPLVVKHRLSGTWASVAAAPGLQGASSVMMHWLRGPTACGISPDEGSN